LMQKILLAVAVLAGLSLAYVDARPTWDDTGILAGSLLLVAGLLTLLGHRRPWLIALAVGIWIPLHDIFLSHDIRMLLVLLFPLVGAYAGWAARLGIRKTFHVTYGNRYCFFEFSPLYLNSLIALISSLLSVQRNSHVPTKPSFTTQSLSC
jgi:hypothetical protein